MYRIGPYNAYVADLMGKYLAQAPYKNIVILAEDSAYGTDFSKNLAERLGGNIKSETSASSVEPAVLTETLAKVTFEGTTGPIMFEQREGTTVWNQALTRRAVLPA